MIDRRLLQPLHQALTEAPAVALLGPRQVGKTTLARHLAASRPSIYLDLEADADLAKLADPVLYLSQHRDKGMLCAELRGRDAR